MRSPFDARPPESVAIGHAPRQCARLGQSDVATTAVDAGGALPALRGIRPPGKDVRIDEHVEEGAQRTVAHGRAPDGAVDGAPRLPGRESDRAVDARVHDRVEHADGDARAEVAHQEALDSAGRGPLLGEDDAGEGEVAGLLLAVVLGGGLDHGVGVGVLAGQLLQEVRDLLAAEDEQAEERRHGHEDRQQEVLKDADDRAVEWVLGLRPHLREEADEEAGVARLLPHLVQQVVHPGVGEVGPADDLDAEPGHQDRLEADARVDDGGELLAREGALLFSREGVRRSRARWPARAARRAAPARRPPHRGRRCRARGCASTRRSTAARCAARPTGPVPPRGLVWVVIDSAFVVVDFVWVMVWVSMVEAIPVFFTI